MEIYAEFMQGCTSDEGVALEAITRAGCECVFDWLAERVPIEDYQAFEAALEQNPDAEPPAWRNEVPDACLPSWEQS